MPVPAGPMPKVMVLRADRVHVALLVERARTDLAAAVRPHHVAVHLGRAARGVDGDVHERLHDGGVDGSAGADDGEQLVHGVARLGHGFVPAVQREHVAAQGEGAVEALSSQDLEMGVVLPREGEGGAVAVQVDDGAHAVPRYAPSRSRTR